MKLLLRIVFYLSLINVASAQQTWGLAGSNFAGVSNIDLNPSTMIFSKCTWDLNLMSVDGSLLNNSFYTSSQFAFPQFFKPEITFATSNMSNKTKLLAADLVITDNIQNSTFLNISSTIKGPSFMFSNGEDAFAITTALRGGVSAFNLPKTLVQLAYENLNDRSLYNQPFKVDNGVGGAAMAWFEIGGSYAKKLSENAKYIYAGGVSLKALVGFAGGYGLSNGIDYTVPYRGNFSPTNLNLGYGHSINTEKAPISLSNPLGSGTTMDIGFTVIQKKHTKSRPYYSCPNLTGGSSSHYSTAKNYKWKFGFSLIDLGGITFSNSASAYNYKNVDTSWDKITRVNPKTLAQVDQLMYDKFNGANNASMTNRFFVWAPSAASIQYDYNYNDLIYVNFSVVQRIVINTEARLARMNTLAFTPRYERSDLEIALPFILNEYLYPNLGLMVRYKFFFIGSDQLGSTLGFASLYGLNLYFGFKINHIGRIGSDPRMVY
ncbi:MAG: DUF5723 family protein [Bacteroidota bacterium]